MTEVFLHSLEGIFTLMLIGAIGYFLGHYGILNKDTNSFCIKMVNSVSLPLFLFYSLTTTFGHDDLFYLLKGALVPAIAIIITYVIAIFTTKLVKVEKKHAGLFKASFAASNTIFIGIPIDIALFGVESVPYALLYYFANTTFFWTIGHWEIASDAGKNNKFLSLGTLKKVFSYPFIGFLTAITVILIGIPVPKFILDSAHYVGSMTTPLAIIIIGYVLFTIKLKNIRVTKDLFVLMLGRFIISPLVIVAVMQFIHLPELMAKVFIVQAALPVIVQAVIMASYYETDPEFGATAVALSTLLAIGVVPILMLLINI